MQPSTTYASSLSFLLSQVGAATARSFAAELATLDVSPRAFGVLSNLAARGGQTQQELADALGIHRNNMVALVDALEGTGWVRRQRHPHDRRAFEVRLTERGEQVVGRVARLIPAIDERIGRSLDDRQRGALVEALQQIAGDLGLHPGVHPHLGAGR